MCYCSKMVENIHFEMSAQKVKMLKNAKYNYKVILKELSKMLLK